jgi:hypothetical protein
MRFGRTRRRPTHPAACHCEERSDAAIQGGSTGRAGLHCRAANRRLAMTEFPQASARVFV